MTGSLGALTKPGRTRFAHPTTAVTKTFPQGLMTIDFVLTGRPRVMDGQLPSIFMKIRMMLMMMTMMLMMMMTMMMTMMMCMTQANWVTD